jgi:hypothetical protein
LGSDSRKVYQVLRALTMNRQHENSSQSNDCNVAWLFALILLILASVVWVMNRTTASSLLIPFGYANDWWLVFANAKVFMDGDVFPVAQKWVAHLNAPLVANWNDWPITEEMISAITGWIGSFSGLFVAANLVLASCHVLAGVSFWLVGRELQLKREYVFLGAVAYALSHYIFVRGFVGHIVLTMYWHLPWLCIISWWTYEREPMSFATRHGRIALIFSVIAGALNPYYAWMYIQFLGFALLKHLVNRQFRSMLSPLVLVFATLTTFALFNADTLSYKWVHGENGEAVARSLAGLETYGLKLPELFLPSSHRLKLLSEFSQARYYSVALIKGEMGSPYLGMAGIVGLIWLLSHGLFYLLRNRPYRVSPAWWQVIWVSLYSLIGGINLVLGSFGLVLFRGTNRFSIVILTLALLFLVQALSKSFPGKVARVLALMCIPLVLWDQLPRQYPSEQLAADTALFESDRSFSRTLEASLPKNAMVFQLPVMAYPEVPPIAKMADYEHFRPYLHTSTLRYSYGTTKGRGDAEWQAEVAALPVSDMLTRLEQYGFESVMINRKGYEDRAEQLIKALREAGKQVISENADLIAFGLNPAQYPKLPVSSYFSFGWSAPEIGHRWAVSKSTKILVHNPESKTTNREIRFGLRGIQAQEISISLNGKIVHELTLEAGGIEVPVSFSLELVPGENNITLVSDVNPAPPGGSDIRTLAFDLINYVLN